MVAVDNSSSRVAQRDGYPSHSATPIVAQRDPYPSHSATLSYNRTSKENPGDHNPPADAAGGEMPGRFELGVARRDGTLDDVLRKIDIAALQTKRLSALPDR